MSQPSIASFFNTRKRPATDDIISTKNKVFLTDSTINDEYVSQKINDNNSVVCPRYFLNVDQCKNIPGENSINNNNLLQYFSAVPSSLDLKQDNNHQLKSAITTRSGRIIKRTVVTETTDIIKSKTSKIIGEEPSTKKGQQQKLVEFVKKGYLSPKNKLTPIKDANQTFATKETNIDVQNKQQQNSISNNARTEKEQLKNLVKKELNFDEVKTKLTRSAKLQELKASLGRIKELEKTRKEQEEKNIKLKNGINTEPKKSTAGGLTLKEFKTIELEILTSPRKGLSTPTKLIPATPDKNELMSPKKTATPKRILFSPTKDGSPSKIVVPPAYQRFLNLAESSKTTTSLQLPYKYRFLIEVFKCVDTVAAMFFNRKEIITFKKLKPGVQRMLRKNFNELHLSQIKNLYPDAFIYHQMKMRNYGSISKQDYFQLVITPNIGGANAHKLTKIDEDNVLKSAQSNAMNPQIIIERQQKFVNILLEKVKIEHDKFLKSLDPPLDIPIEKMRRWHPEFDLENCPDIELGHLPQPPNVDKYSSAKDILSTARNLFNCTTPMERVMNRYELAKLDPQNKELLQSVTTTTTPTNTPDITITSNKNDPIANATATLLKGVPKSLLDKIRAKQAARALDTITRRPSQDSEVKKFSRLPELARHLRNVFITEKKGVLPLENVIKKIENSYRTFLTQQDIECHLKMIAKQCPNWIVFHDIRNTIYLKMTRDLNLVKIIEKLENTANEKLK